MRMDGCVDEVNLIILPNDPLLWAHHCMSRGGTVAVKYQKEEIKRRVNEISLAPSKVIYQCSVCRWTSGCSGTQWLLVPKRITTQFLLTSNPICTMAQQKSSVIQWICNFLAFIYLSLSVCLCCSAKEHIIEFCWCSIFQWDFDFWLSQDHTHGAWS